MNVGVPELLILAMLVAAVAVPIFTLVDIVSKPSWAFERANQIRTLWVVFAALGIPFCGLGLLVAAAWFIGVRPRVVAETEGMPPAA